LRLLQRAQHERVFRAGIRGAPADPRRQRHLRGAPESSPGTLSPYAHPSGRPGQFHRKKNTPSVLLINIFNAQEFTVNLDIFEFFFKSKIARSILKICQNIEEKT